VKPKIDFLNIQEGRAEVARKQLEEKNEELRKVNEFVAELQSKSDIQ
jgi:hypothetical protein